MADKHGPTTAEVDARQIPARAAAKIDGGRGAGAATAADTGEATGVDRVAELEAALEAAKAEAAENWDKYLRERAEMENFRRRVERTYADLARRGRKEFLLKLLGVLDNLERAIAYEPASGEAGAGNLLAGVRMTYQQFADLLAGEGLKEVTALGEPFDPALHEAVATEAAPDRPDGQIVAVVQKGYTHGDELLRPARVKVAKNEQ